MIKIACAFMLALLGVVALATFYVQSDSFRKKIASTLSTALGESIELGDELSVDSLYPKIGVTLPNAQLRTSPSTRGLSRARLQNLQLSISYTMLFSVGTKGRINITADNLSIITDAEQAGASINTQSDLQLPFDAPAMSLAQQLDVARMQLSDLVFTVIIAEIDYYARNKQTQNQSYHLSNVRIANEKDEALRISGNVNISDESSQKFTAKLEANARKVKTASHSAGGSFNLSLDAYGKRQPLHQLNGRWQLANNNLTIDHAEYRSEDAWLRGKVDIRYSAQETFLSSDLELRQWNINTTDSANSATRESTPDTKSPSYRYFSYDVFTASLPSHLKADVRLDLGAVRFNRMPILNGQLQIAFANGKLDVLSKNLTLLGGASDFTMQFDQSAAPVLSLKLKLESDKMQLDRLRLPASNDTLLSRGEADLIIALRAAGPSTRHMAASMDGYVIATAHKAQVKQEYSTLLDVGVVNWALDNVSLLAKEDDEERNSAILSDPLLINCAALRLYINDGRIETSNGAIVEFLDNSLYSSGYIDLEAETLGFAFRTKNRNIFDWSAISIAKYAEISGTLAQPVIRLNPVELTKQGLITASSVAWGPLPGLVYSLAESGIRNRDSTQCSSDTD